MADRILHKLCGRLAYHDVTESLKEMAEERWKFHSERLKSLSESETRSTARSRARNRLCPVTAMEGSNVAYLKITSLSPRSRFGA